MTARLTLVGCLALGCLAVTGAAAPVPQEKPVIKCELRWTGKFEPTISGRRMKWEAPDGADMAVTNVSDADIDIGSNCGPEMFLSVRVKAPGEAEAKTYSYSSVLSPATKESEPYILKPGEALRGPISLLALVPERQRVVGTYKVRVVFTYKRKEYESAEVEVKWTGEVKNYSIPPGG